MVSTLCLFSPDLGIFAHSSCANRHHRWAFREGVGGQHREGAKVNGYRILFIFCSSSWASLTWKMEISRGKLNTDEHVCLFQKWIWTLSVAIWQWNTWFFKPWERTWFRSVNPRSRPFFHLHGCFPHRSTVRIQPAASMTWMRPSKRCKRRLVRHGWSHWAGILSVSWGRSWTNKGNATTLQGQC